MIFLNVLGAILIGNIAKAEKPLCDANHITNKCEFFKKRKEQPYIQLPDGTMFRNPLFQGGGLGLPEEPSSNANGSNQYAQGGGNVMATGYGGTANPEAHKEVYETMMVGQSQIIDGLEKANVSTRFKLAFAQQNLGYFNAPVLSVPWPPNDKNAAFKTVSVNDVEEYLKKNMPRKAYESLRQQIETIKAPALKQLATAQAEQQKLIAAETAQKEKEAKEQAENVALREKRKKRVAALFKETKELVISTIARGRKIENLSPDEKLLVRKIETVEMNPIDVPDNLTKEKCSGNENAYYVNVTHRFTLCPNIIMNADSQMVSVIAHELTHAIDPCRAKFPLYEVDQDKLESLLKDSKISEDARGILAEIKKLNIKFSNDDFDLSVTSLEAAKFVKESGVLKRIGGELKAYPFQNEMNCFARESKFPQNTQKDISYAARTFSRLASMQEKGAAKILNETARRYEKAGRKYPECVATLGLASQMTETISDAVAAVVSEKYLLDNPFKSEEEKVAGFMFARSTCHYSGSTSQSDANIKSISPMAAQTILANPHLSDPHPSSGTRTEKIMLNLPGMAKMLDCKRVVPACIDHLSFANRPTAKAGSKGSSNSQGAVQ